MQCTAGADDAGRRFDRICRKLLPGTGLGAIYAALRKGRITVNGTKKPPSYTLREGDVIAFPPDFTPRGGSAEKGGHPGDGLVKAIIFENSHFVVFNKPSGILTHGNGSLGAFLPHYLQGVMEQSLAFTPAPLHRLDRNTSGIVVCGKSIRGAVWFSDLLSRKQAVKAYIGIHDGILRSPEHWEDRLKRNRDVKITISDPAGSRSVLHIFPLLRSASKTFCLTVAVTGRTHQIRAQAALHGLPLTGDVKYNEKTFRRGGYALHAFHMRFRETEETLGLPPLYARLPGEFREQLTSLFPGGETKKFLHRLKNEITGKIASISLGK